MNKYLLDFLSFGMVALFMTLIAALSFVFDAGGQAKALTTIMAGIGWSFYGFITIMRKIHDG